MEKIKYCGLFFDFYELQKRIENIDRKPLYRIIKNPHITVLYRPQNVPEELVGKSLTVKVVGYGQNQENEALLVEFSSVPDLFLPFTSQVEIPHITLSVAENGRSVNSNNLDFKPTEPFLLEGIFGVMYESGKLQTK